MVRQAALAWWAEADISPLGNGHIHQTFLVSVGKTGERFVLQRVNQAVFADVQTMALQTPLLLAHLAADPEYAKAFAIVDLVPTHLGALVHAEDDQIWRAWRYVEQSRVVDPFTNLLQVESAAFAFGAFQRSLAEFKPQAWRPPIPGFLELSGYMQVYRQSVEDAESDSVPADVAVIIDASLGLLSALGAERVFIHGDCKINNVLFENDRDQAKAVIDLDTVGLGHWAWDFGDLVRSVAFSDGAIELDQFVACVDGFSRGRGGFAQSIQTTADQMSIAPAYIALTLGVRFITDHLRGDEYFKVSVRGDNVRRAREQLRLLEQFIAQRKRLFESALSRLTLHARSSELS
ncbi:MAG: hypothetical protein CMQ22_04525 [Gammaproteobacteria bacterium]|nr:hypothetical protein [Gammaproteobacteria bacterium]